MKKTKYLVPLAALLGGLVIIQLLHEEKTSRKEAVISSLLAQNPRFQNLVVEQMKPGWHRISGKVTLTNDLVVLKELLDSNGISQCTILVVVE